MDRVVITIKGSQKGPDGQVEKVNLMFKGRYACKAGKHYLRYDDRKLVPKEIVSTTIKLSAKEMAILRHGAVETEQRFLLGQKTRAEYHTPYGLMELTMSTSLLTVDFQADLGEARLQYSMEANGSLVGDYDLKIRVVPA